MHSKELILHNLVLSREMVLGLVNDMDDCCLTHPTINGGNHAMWILGHLAVSEGTLIQEWALEQPNPFEDWKQQFNNGTNPVSNASFYPRFEVVRDKCVKIRNMTIDILKGFSEADIERNVPAVPKQFQEYFPRMRDCFNMTSLHWLEHKGQLADARRLAGLPILYS